MTTSHQSFEEVARWEPVAGLPLELYCDSISHDTSGLTITLMARVADARLRLVFESPYAYQNINETFRMRTWVENANRPGTLLTIKNSRWVKWLASESQGLLDEESITHYAIYTEEDCIDVISRFAPKAHLDQPGRSDPVET